MLSNPLGGERRFFSWREHSIAYVVRGAGPPMLLVHSIHACSWSMEWRRALPGLSERFTTYSIDLLGFGASSHPPISYDARLYIELIHDFLTQVIGKPAVLVGSSLGATYLAAIAAHHPALATAVCAIGPAGVSRLTTPSGAAGALVQSIFRNKLFGAALFSKFTSRASIRFFLKDIYFDRSNMTDEAVELYWAGAHQVNAQYAPSAFVGMRLNYDLRPDLKALACPVLLLWGRNASQTPLSESVMVKALLPQATLEVLPGGDLPHEESPEQFVQAVARFVGASAGLQS